MLWAVFVVAASLTALFFGGWVFLDSSLYKDQEDKDPVVQVRPLWLPSFPILFPCPSVQAS